MVIVLVVLFALAAAFVLLNWSALSAPVTLSLGVGSVATSYGMVVLTLVALLGLAFAAWAMSMLAESHRRARALEAQRELADKAEASRFTELRGFVHDELRRLADDTRIAIEQQHASLVAQLAAFEDRLDRSRAGLPAEPRADERAPARR